LFPARRIRPFVSPSCSREVDRLASSALGSCSQHVESDRLSLRLVPEKSIVWRAAPWVLVPGTSNQTVCLSVLFPRSRSFDEQRLGFLFPAHRIRPFVSPSCSREVDRLASSAWGSCSRRVESDRLSLGLVPEKMIDWRAALGVLAPNPSNETVCLCVLLSRRQYINNHINYLLMII